jgi:hypothetical protein
MSSGEIPVLKFLFNEDFKVLNEALGLKQVYDIEVFDSANDMATFLSTIPAGLVIISLRDKNDLVQVATFMKIVKKVAKDTALKVVIINFSGQKIFENAIAKIGIQDSIDLSITTKALKFKIDFWMKSLKGQMKVPAGTSQPKALKGQDSKSTDKKLDLSTPQWLDPLKLEDDIWILKTENDCKKILSKWLVRMMGPGPNVGQWYEVRHGLWRFDLRPEDKELYVSGKGSWFFTGDQKPEFIWKENSWMMSGLSYELFYKEGPSVYSRLKSKNKVLEIATNSVFAKTKETIIIESFNKEMVFKKEAMLLEDLEGKDKTDHLDHGPLSGETSLLDELDGNLSGKTKGEDGLSNFWNGKLGQNQSQSKNDLKLKTGLDVQGTDLERERKDQHHQKYYKNHNEFEEPEAGNLEGEGKNDTIQKHYKNKSDGSSEEKSKNYSGKIQEKEDKQDGFYKSKLTRPSQSPVDPEALAGSFKKNAPANVVPFLTIAQEKELSEITADAKVTSFIILGDRKVSCKLDDYFDDKVIFHTDDPTFKIPADVQLDLLYEALANESELKIEGNVVTIDSDGEGDSFVTIQISELQANQLQDFMKNFEVRQNNINQFMKKVKGF